MNVGTSRGNGGIGLFRHWTKSKNERVVALPARFLGAESLKDQVLALTAQIGHATFQRPVVHMWFPPNPADRKPTRAEMDDLLARIEREFHLENQARVGVMHVLTRDIETAAVERHPSWADEDTHEHYAWGLCAEDGRAVDHFKNDFIRKERVIVEWQVAHDFQITPLKHEKAVLAYLDQHNPAAAAAMRGEAFDGTGPARVALYDTAERAQMERNAAVDSKKKTKHAFNARRDVLAAWKASDTAAAFEAALAVTGYRLAKGERAAVIVDPAGIEHKATDLIGNASAKLDDKRIGAAEVNARLADHPLVPLDAMRQVVREMEAGQDPALLTPPVPVPPPVITGPALEEIRDAKTVSARQQDDDPRDLGGSGRDQDGGASVAVAAGAAGCGQPGPGAGPVGGDRGPARPAGPAPGACRGRLVAGRQRLARHRRTELDALTARVRLGPPRPPPRHPAGPAKVQAAWQVAVAPFDPQYDSARRAQFKARLLSRAYDCGWLPPAVAENISWIDYDQQRQRVTLHLRSGGQLVDDGERITLVGDPSDVAVWEVVEAAARRGWDAIEVKGDAAFRREVAVRCALREPPIIVANYELSPADQDVVDLILAQRQAASLLPAVSSVDVALPTSRH